MTSYSDNGLIRFSSRAQMASRVADLIASQLAVAIGQDGKAVLALSGGSTPEMLHRELAQRPLDWSRVTVIPVDDRWVEKSEPGSNEAFLQRTFLDEGAAAATLIGLKSQGARPQDGLAAARQRVRKLGKRPDAIVYGMGNDGHTASWFPHADGLADALDMASGEDVAAVTAIRSEVTGDLVDRITLTLPFCRRAPLQVLLMTGEAKAQAFARAQAEIEAETSDVSQMPVRALFRHVPDLWPCWAE